MHAQKVFTVDDKTVWSLRGQVEDIIKGNLCYSLYLEEAHLDSLLSVKMIIMVRFS